MSSRKQSPEMNSMDELKVSELEMEAFTKIYKQGIYKELHAKELLTDQQLNQLLNHIY